MLVRDRITYHPLEGINAVLKIAVEREFTRAG